MFCCDIKQSFVDFIVVTCTEQLKRLWLYSASECSGWRPSWIDCFGLFLNTQWVCPVPWASALDSFNASPLSPGAPWGGKVASKRVEKEHYLLKPLRSMLRGHFSSKVDLLHLFFPLCCNSAIVLFVYTLFAPLYPFLPSKPNLTCAWMRSSHYFTFQGDVKFAPLTPHPSLRLFLKHFV